MSYILDALRKSEEKRTKSGTQPARPGFTFVKHSQPTKKNKFAFGLIFTSFMLVSSVILGAGWWWSQKEQTDSVVNSTTAPPVKAAAETATETPGPLPAASPPEPSPTASGSKSPPQLLVPSVQPTDEIPYLEDMSNEFQQKIPTLSFSGHVYSDEPGLRMIMINDGVVREGDPVGTELTLHEITADGVVMGFKETRFRVKLF